MTTVDPTGRSRGGAIPEADPQDLSDLRAQNRARAQWLLAPFRELGRATAEGWMQLGSGMDQALTWALEQLVHTGEEGEQVARETFRVLGFSDVEIDAILAEGKPPSAGEIANRGGAPAPAPLDSFEAMGRRGEDAARAQVGSSARGMTPDDFLDAEDPWLWPSGMAAPPEPSGLRWRESATQDLFTLPVEDLIRLQTEMERAGLLPRPYVRGRVDVATMTAYSELLGWSNLFGGRDLTRTVEDIERLEVLEDPEASGIAPFRRERFVSPIYEAPDPATVAQSVKAAWEGRLGRPLSPEETSHFSSVFTGAHREAFDQVTEHQRMAHDRGQWEAQQEHRRLTEPAPLDSTEAAARRQLRGPAPPLPPGEVQAIDPAARVAEEGERVLGPELREDQRRAAAFNQRQSLEDAMRAMSAGVNRQQVGQL